ncbi:MAG: hypothetical protein HZB21_07015 [Deltaproteobacteria bacterium]|nr:hypothetical protein [Deltaproteobacteria bacterium]
MMPYPFSKGVFICGEPIRVNPQAGPDEMEEVRHRLEAALNGLTERADSYFKRP